MSRGLRPPVRWFGSKTRIAPQIAAMLPPHDHYVEVFAGSCAVLFAKAPSSMETVNDLSGDIVNLFQVLRDRDLCRELAEQVDLTPYARDEFAACAEPSDDPVERARRLLVRCNQAVGNAGQGWSYVANRSAVSAARVHRFRNLPNRIIACIERLRFLQIDALDWRLILERYDKPGVVMFLDPPYHHETRENTVGAYEHEMTDEDHEDLVDRLLCLEHAAAVVVHYPHPTYDRLAAAGWDVVDIASHADNQTARRQVERTERVWCSHPVAARFDFGAAS